MRTNSFGADHHRLGRALRRPVVHGLDVVAVGAEQKGGEIPRMVVPLARRTVVATAGSEASGVETAHRAWIACLKCQVHVTRGCVLVAERIDPQLVTLQMFFVVSVDRYVERTERRAIEAFARGEIVGSQMDGIDEASEVPFAHEGCSVTANAGTRRRRSDESRAEARPTGRLLILGRHHSVVTGLDLGGAQLAVMVLVHLLEHLLRAGFVLGSGD